MRVYIAGINGMVGSAIALEANAQGHLVLGKSSSAIDFRDRNAVFLELQNTRPDALIIAAAKVGGIGANLAEPVDFLSINLQIQTNLLDAAHASKIEKVIFLGSSCVYPKYTPQPIPESALLSGALDESIESYGIAKIAGLRLIQSYRLQYGWDWTSAILTNLYGPNDNFDSEGANVLPGLMDRIHQAKVNTTESVEIWGDGTPLREFLFVGDLACAIMLLVNSDNLPSLINIGSNQEISIGELALLLAKTIQFKGKIVFNTARPNGTPRKLLDSSKISQLGWEPQVTLEDGILQTYKWFLEQQSGRVR